MARRKRSAKMERCIQKVKARNRKRGTKKANPFAVCANVGKGAV